jgi:hypothetical protein
MKKFILVSMLGLISMVGAFAQSTIGISALKETGAAGNYGIGVQYGYQVGNINIVPSVSYSFEKTQSGPVKADDYKYGQLGANLDFQYIVKIKDFIVYPLIGANFTNFSKDGDFGNSNLRFFGLNAGGGVKHAISGNLSAVAETKHRYLFKKSGGKADNAAVVSLGLLYSF